VLNPNYGPSTPQEQEMMQIFIYAALENKVMTSKGKEIVRKYEHTRDAQKAYKELTQHHRLSTAAFLAARDIIGYLTSVAIGDGRLRGTTIEFVAHWTQQTNLYQMLIHTSGSALHGMKPRSTIQSCNRSCQRCPLDLNQTTLCE
jgi:hypothetical protein